MNVMVLAGVELIFFIEAYIMLCVGLWYNSVNKTVIVVAAEQCLHGAKNIPASRAALPASRLQMCRKLGEDRSRTADPNWPKEYSILYGVGPRICPAFLAVAALSAYQWNVAK